MTLETRTHAVLSIAQWIAMSFAVWVAVSFAVLSAENPDNRKLFSNSSEYWQFIFDPIYWVACLLAGGLLYILVATVYRVIATRNVALQFIKYMGSDAALSSLAQKAQQLDALFKEKAMLECELSSSISGEEFSFFENQYSEVKRTLTRVKEEFLAFHEIAKMSGIPVFDTRGAHAQWQKSELYAEMVSE